MKNTFQFFIYLMFAGNLSAQCINVSNCPAAALEFCDLTPNDAQLWNESFWWDPVNLIHDVPENSVQLSVTASETCTGAALSFKYELWLDTDNNGTRETVVTSDNFPAYGTVNFDNAANPNFSGGTAQSFDERPVTADLKYGFALEQTTNGANTSASVRWSTTQNPNTYVDPQLPYGNHKIKWTVSNGLGQTSTCEYEFIVKDCKKPTVVCLNGLSVNIMPTGMIQLWASDFLQYTEDNATPTGQIDIAVRKSGTGTGFPVDPGGSPQASVIFDCSELGTQLVELWAKDNVGNSDFCETYVIVMDNMGNCPDSNEINVQMCSHMWCNNAIIANVNYGLNAIADPNNQACVIFPNIPIGSSISLTPTLETNPLNGVNVFDLIKISKHILGLAPLPSPYAMIAADANKNNSITTTDIVEYRKLLLGLYGELPNNSSWRFVDAGYVFPNPNNPFSAVFPQFMQVNNILNDTTFNFVGIKNGDVDCSAMPGFDGSVDDRDDPVTLFNLQDRYLQAGEIVDLPLRLSATGEWLGFQLGLSIDPQLLHLEDVIPGNLPDMDTDNFAVLPDLINMVWSQGIPVHFNAQTNLFTLRVRAGAPGWLHDGLALSSGPGNLHGEAYNNTEIRSRLQLEFNAEQSVSGITDIFSPFPNPTSGGATIPVQLANPDPVRIELWDISGKILFENTQSLDAGFHNLEIPATVFPGSGMYFWRVQAGDVWENGKLLRI